MSHSANLRRSRGTATERVPTDAPIHWEHCQPHFKRFRYSPLRCAATGFVASILLLVASGQGVAADATSGAVTLGAFHREVNDAVQRELLPALSRAAEQEFPRFSAPAVRVVVSDSMVAQPSRLTSDGTSARIRVISLGAIALGRAAIDATLVAGRLGSSPSAIEGLAAYFSYLARLADARESVVEPGDLFEMRVSFADFMHVPPPTRLLWEQDPGFRRQRTEMYSSALAWAIAHQYVHAILGESRRPALGRGEGADRWLEMPHDRLTLQLLRRAGLLSAPAVAALRLDNVLEARPGPSRWIGVRCRTLSLAYLAASRVASGSLQSGYDEAITLALTDQLARAGCR